MTLLHHHLLALALIATTTSTLCIFVLIKNPSRPLNRIFSLYMSSVAWWSTWEFMGQFSPNELVALHRVHLEYLGVCFVPVLFLHGITHLINMRRSAELGITYAISIIFASSISILKLPAFISHTAPIAYLPHWPQAGPLFILFVLFFTLVALRTHWLLYRAFRNEVSPLKKIQLKLLFFASTLAYLGAIPEFTLKLGLQIPFLNPFGLYSIPIYIFVVVYAIIQFRLLDIHIAIRKSLAYSILVTLLTAGYFGLVYGIERTFQIAFGYQSGWLSLGAFALMALAFQPLKIGIQRFVDWLIFRVPQETLAKRVERLEEQAIQSEKFKAASTLAAGMAHEIKNPLTAINTFTEFIPERHTDPVFAAKLHEILTIETKRIQGIIREVLTFAKPKDPKIEPNNPESLITSTVDLLSNDLLKNKINWEVTYRHNGHSIQADPDQLRQVLINLIQNAADAMPEGGKLTIVTQPVNGYMEITVADTGKGIPKELLPKIFDPFVTTKQDGNGLGLAMVYSMLRANRGSIRAENRRPANDLVAGRRSADGSVADLPTCGSAFTVSLPT